MKFKPYSKYKDSDVEWIGDVPESWQICPVKKVASLMNGYPFDSEFFSSDGGFPLIRIRDLNKATTETYYTGNFVKQAAITADDVLIGMDGDFNVGRWHGLGEGLLNQRMCCIRTDNTSVIRFLEYALPVPLKLINDVTYSTTVKHLASSQVAKIRFALPDAKEVDFIVGFLDRETAKIDNLIAKQEKLIELLKEKRHAVISHAVTKGLDPSTPTKPSGIEWLGDVPEHWVLPRINYVANVRNGSTPDRSNLEYWNGTIPWLSSGKVNDFIIESADEFVTQSALDNSSLSRFPAGSVLVGLVGQGRTRGMCAMLTFQSCINQNVAGIIVKPILDPTFLLYALVAAYQSLRDFGRGGQQDALNCEILGAFRIPLPPLKEQKEIVEHIQGITSKIDALIAKSGQAIGLQKEHRTALISAAVTGKIDVRETASELQHAA